MKRVIVAAAGGLVAGSLYVLTRRKPTYEEPGAALQELIAKLCRELSQSEHSAVAQPRREARRLGDTPPAHALRSIADHAEQLRPRFDALVTGRLATRRGLELGRLVGELFSAARNAAFDRLIDSERSYRGTLLGIEHGLDLVRLLLASAREAGDQPLLTFCEDWLAGRLALVGRAKDALGWFATEPQLALHAGTRLA